MAFKLWFTVPITYLNMIPICLVSFIVAASFVEPSSGAAIRSQPASHLMFDYNWPQPDFKIKKVPHEKYCHYYYQWESGDLYTVKKCPAGEIFDYHSHECKEKKGAQCWSHHYGKTKGHEHIHSKLKNFECPFSSGKYPDVFICENYFVCKNGISHQKHCPPTKLFDRIRRQCVDESVALCADITDAEDINHRCPKPSGTFGHPKDCSKYFTCIHGKPSLKKCSEGEFFNEVEKYCTHEEVHCGNRSMPHSEGKVSRGNQETSKNNPSTTSDIEPGIRSTSETHKTYSNLSKSESILPTQSSAAQTTASETKKSSSTASRNSNNGDDKVAEMSVRLSTSNDKSMLSTRVST